MIYENLIFIGQLSLRKSASKIDSKHKTDRRLGKTPVFFFINPNGSFRN
jgi:hypothetical protein